MGTAVLLPVSATLVATYLNSTILQFDRVSGLKI